MRAPASGKEARDETLFAAALAVTIPGLATAADMKAEVLHWWTSGGEASALNVLKEDLKAKGIGWQDMPVAGGGGCQCLSEKHTHESPPCLRRLSPG